MMDKILCFFFGHQIMLTFGNEGGDGAEAKLYTEDWCKRCMKSFTKKYIEDNGL